MSLGVKEEINYTFQSGLNKGKTVRFSQLDVQDFIEIQREALKVFKRRFIETYTDNLDLFPEDKKEGVLLQAMAEAREIDVADLPSRTMKMPMYKLNDKKQRVLITRNGQPIMQEKQVDYAMHWMSDTPEGKLHVAWLSLKKVPGQESMTIRDADALFLDSQADLEEAAQMVGNMSGPQIGTEEEKDPANFTKQSQVDRRARKREERRRKRLGG